MEINMSRHRDKISRSRIARKLTASSSLAAAGLGLTGGAQTDAAVVPFNPPGGPITIHRIEDGSNDYYENFDIDGNSINDFALWSYYGPYLLTWAGQGHSETSLIMNNGFEAAIVAPGASVGPDTTGWPNDVSIESFVGTRGYAGVVFDIPGGSPHFAYLDIEVASDLSFATVHGGAYESLANTPIQTPVPEPGSLLLLASGAAGLAAWRRKRASTATTSDK